MGSRAKNQHQQTCDSWPLSPRCTTAPGDSGVQQPYPQPPPPCPCPPWWGCGAHPGARRVAARCCGGCPAWLRGCCTLGACTFGPRAGQQPRCMPRVRPAEPQAGGGMAPAALPLAVLWHPPCTPRLSPNPTSSPAPPRLSPALTLLGSNVSGWGQRLSPDQNGTPGLLSWHGESKVRPGDASGKGAGAGGSPRGVMLTCVGGKVCSSWAMASW